MSSTNWPRRLYSINKSIWHLTLFLSLILCDSILTERVSMKIVDEPSSYGFNQPYGQVQNTDTAALKMRVKPSNFSGPSHLRHLLGKCFSLLTDSYKYEFCPFSNITQHEQSLRWNPYSGILGIYQEWEIENNTFTAILMKEGDKCGKIFRSSKIIFHCGEKNDLTNVSEPATCNYHFLFNTPYVCHPHSMLVYPTLAEKLQMEWDELEGELSREEITKKGYDKMLRTIFEKAGYYLSAEVQHLVSQKALAAEVQAEKDEKGEFETLSKCTEEYNKLKMELEGSKALLELKTADKIAENTVENSHMQWHDIYD